MAAAEAPSQAQIDAGKAVFMKQAAPTCATCHTLKDAGASGAIGPDLDELKPSEQQIRAVLRDGSGAMPSFEGTLSKEQLDAVTAYVYWATHAGYAPRSCGAWPRRGESLPRRRFPRQRPGTPLFLFRRTPVPGGGTVRLGRRAGHARSSYSHRDACMSPWSRALPGHRSPCEAPGGGRRRLMAPAGCGQMCLERAARHRASAAARAGALDRGYRRRACVQDFSASTPPRCSWRASGVPSAGTPGSRDFVRRPGHRGANPHAKENP
jgi:cytochrome c553